MKKETINRLAELKARRQEIQMQEFKLWDERYHIEKEIDKIMKDEHPCPDCNTVGKLRSEDGWEKPSGSVAESVTGQDILFQVYTPSQRKSSRLTGRSFWKL